MSYGYHEQLLALHQQLYGQVQKALSRPEVERDYPEKYKFFREVAFKNFDKVPTPGQVSQEFQRTHCATGSFRSIADYQETMYSGYWEWMTDKERETAHSLWLQMSQMWTNIRRTVDRSWSKTDDNVILNTRYTGPPGPRTRAIKCSANKPPRWLEGMAFASKPAAGLRGPDPRDRRYTVAVGDHLPDLESRYGITVWQRIDGGVRRPIPSQ